MTDSIPTPNEGHIQWLYRRCEWMMEESASLQAYARVLSMSVDSTDDEKREAEDAMAVLRTAHEALFDLIRNNDEKEA